MTLAIADGHSVSFHYRLTLQDGSIVDDSFEGAPLEYVHGGQSIVPGLEQALVGLRAGDERDVIVAPKDAYGDHDPEAVLTVSRADFPEGMDIEPGMSLRAQGPDGTTQVWVKEVKGDDVVITPNHPLAGETLTFKVRIIDVREASAEGAEPKGG